MVSAPGKVNVKATREIALEEYDFVHDHLAGQGSRGDGSPPAIVTYGWSIGTGLAVHVASRRAVAGLILQAPPASADEMAAWSSKHDVPRLARGLVKVTVDAEVQPIYNNVQEIASTSAPLLVVQGSENDVVPITQGREVFAASPAKQKTFVEVPGAHHSDLRVGHPPAGDAGSGPSYSRLLPVSLLQFRRVSPKKRRCNKQRSFNTSRPTDTHCSTDIARDRSHRPMACMRPRPYQVLDLGAPPRDDPPIPRR